MTKNIYRSLTIVFVLVLSLVLINSVLLAQMEDKKESEVIKLDEKTKKLYENISGNWQFTFPDEVSPAKIYVQDGKLMVAPQGFPYPLELMQVKNMDKVFVAEGPDYSFIQLTFESDDKGKIVRGALYVKGQNAKGIKY